MPEERRLVPTEPEHGIEWNAKGTTQKEENSVPSVERGRVNEKSVRLRNVAKEERVESAVQYGIARGSKGTFPGDAGRGKSGKVFEAESKIGESIRFEGARSHTAKRWPQIVQVAKRR